MRISFIVFAGIACLILHSELFAQENYLPGSVTLNSGETIAGEIDYQNQVRTPELVRFRKDSIGEVKTYSPTSILGFRVGRDRFVSKNLIIDTSPYRTSANREIRPSSIQKQVFLQLLVEGAVSLYYYQNERPHYFIETEKGIEELISSQYVVNIGGQFQLVKTNEHLYRRQLAELGYECNTESARKIKYRINAFIEFISECNGDEAPAYIYEKEKPTYKHSFYVGGLTSLLTQKIRPDQPLSTLRSELLQNFKNTYDPSYSFTIGYYFKIIYPTDLQRKSLSIGLDIFTFESKTSGDYYNFIYEENAISELQNISNMQLSFTMISLKSWFSYKFSSKQITPFLDIGASFSRMISHSSKANIHTDFYQTGSLGFNIPLEAFPIIDETDEVRSFYSKEDLYTSGLGILAGLGLQYNSFYATCRGDFLIHNYNQGSQLNVSLIFGYEF